MCLGIYCFTKVDRFGGWKGSQVGFNVASKSMSSSKDCFFSKNLVSAWKPWFSWVRGSEMAVNNNWTPIERWNQKREATWTRRFIDLNCQFWHPIGRNICQIRSDHVITRSDLVRSGQIWSDSSLTSEIYYELPLRRIEWDVDLDGRSGI